MRKFPKNIFQVWYQGCDKIERDDFKINMKKWRDSNSDWNYYCVDDKAMEDVCLKYSKRCYDAYKNAKIMMIKIDLARYVLIYLYGGMYVDMDAYLIRPLNNSNEVKKLIYKYEVENKDVVGLSMCKTNMIESYIFSGYKQTYNTGIMFSSPNNPTMKRFIESVIDSINKYNDSKLLENYIVLKTTGPYIFNKFFRTKENVKDTEILSFKPQVFEPCDVYQNCEINKDTISIHLFELSWVPKSVKRLLNIYKSTRKMIIPIIILIIFYFYYIKKQKK